MNDTNNGQAVLAYIEQLGSIHPTLPALTLLALLIVAAMIIHFIAKSIIVRVAKGIAVRTSVTWDDELVDHNVVGRLVQVLPALIIFVGVGFIPDISDGIRTLLRNVAHSYIILMLTLAISGALTAANDIYEKQPMARARPLKGFFQLVKIGLWLLAGILIVATLIDRSPLLLLSGFGAMTAIVLLVFKDTILSLVASVQLTAQDMIRVGDWIEMPQFGADGDVIDVQLHTVKVQNWDKTITTIPTYRLIDSSFKNWRGMQDSGARR
ncbi:MAG: mechanosensitive ion channel domain-containing protein, partial [Pseudomonadota bacterium]